MKNRKPTQHELQMRAKSLLQNEIENKKMFLDAAEKRVGALVAELTALAGMEKVRKSTIRRIEKELGEQREVAQNIRAWLDKHQGGVTA